MVLDVSFDIHVLLPGDAAAFSAALVSIPGRHDVDGYAGKCLAEQGDGRRTILGAFVSGAEGMAGFAHLIWRPAYPPFARLGIPEIQDLAVLPDFQRRGLGRALVLRCEDEARKRGCQDMGIGVGLHAGYGAAQRLYARLGFMPDGAGVSYDNAALSGGRLYAVDDLLTLKMVKRLEASP